MKITGGRSYIRVETEEGKEIVIQGELTMTPKFYADYNSIKHWEPPFENENITENSKKKLAFQIMNESSKTNVPVIFEEIELTPTVV